MTGIDLVYIPKIARYCQKQSFINRVFTEKEINEFKERNFNPKSIAVAWGAKEAFSKSLGMGILETGLKNISLLHDNNGRPYIEYTGELKIRNIDVTASHEGDYCVVAVKTERVQSVRNPDTDKKDYGKLGIIAGSYGMTGAVFLATMSAMRMGAGLTYVFSPREIIPILQMKMTEPVFIYTEAEKYFKGNNVPEVLEKSKHSDAGVIGCGMSRETGVSDFVKAFIEEFKQPLVIDADGLNAISTEDLKARKFPSIITPHIREFSRLTGINTDKINKNREDYAREFAQENGVVTVLKGHNTVVADTDGEIYINDTGNPGMATAGTGDVLAGITGALIAQGEEPFIAAKKSVRIHGTAGDYAAMKYGEISVIASDLIETLPGTIRDYYLEMADNT